MSVASFILFPTALFPDNNIPQTQNESHKSANAQ